MNTTAEYQDFVSLYFRYHPTDRKKFDSPTNRQQIIRRAESFGVTACETGIQRALQELLSEGRISRIDGGNAQSDAIARATAEQNRLARIANEPLTESDFNQFSRMLPSDVEKLFYSDAEFAAKYRAASRQWGFKIPDAPAPVQAADMPVESDPSKYARMTAKDYWSYSAADVKRLYRADPGFRRATDRLIREGAV